MTTLTARREACRAALQKAQDRRDFRGVHYAQRKLQTLTTAVLKAEVRPSLVSRLIRWVGGSNHGS